jgi:glucose-6-phosphate 1-dehydrogenase
MDLSRPADQDIVIVGATGDLARRKLLPALYRLCTTGLLPERGRIIGYARKPIGTEGFRKTAREAVTAAAGDGLDESCWEDFSQRLVFVAQEPQGLGGVRRLSAQRERLIYLATPPSAYVSIIHAIGEQGLAKDSRLVIEKPFGSDLASALRLEHALHRFFREEQVFRIDHYLGKETVQNILVFRFGNAMFERVWNRDAIESMQVTVAESIGIEGRGAFYEEVGALRDIIQNHVFQILAVLTMEPPISFAPEAVRDERAKLFHAVRPLDPAQVVRGQYARGAIDGRDVPGYREEEGVAPDSQTETFVALQLAIDNWRWAGVPFFLRTGKRLPKRATEVLISFRDVPVRFFEGTGVEELPPNHLSLSIQPDESITFVFLAKVPGPEIRVKPVRMDFTYGESFMGRAPEAYERLLYDALDGDRTLFARADGVQRTWEDVQPVLDAMPPVIPYPAGTWGPAEADELIAPRKWHLR